MARVGATLGAKYSLQSELGRGGMGAVFAAENTWTGRRVAIKTLHDEYAHDPELVDRFWREARCASLLRHPHIVDVLDMGFDEVTGEPFIVQEFIEGPTFDRVAASAPDHRMEPGSALLLLLPVMEALVVCHAAGLVHRDIKPSNILLERRSGGQVVPKLIDFGVSKSPLSITTPKALARGAIGTPQYMSPEQARCEPDVDQRTDVWSMGVTLFEAVTGRLPFIGPTVHVILAQVLHGRVVPTLEAAPDVAPDLAAVIDRALERDRTKRFQTMSGFIQALLRCEVCREPAFLDASKLARARSVTLEEAPPAVDVLDASSGPSITTAPSDETPTLEPTRRPLVASSAFLGVFAALALLCVTLAVIAARTSQPLGVQPLAAVAPAAPAPVPVETPTRPDAPVTATVSPPVVSSPARAPARLPVRRVVAPRVLAPTRAPPPADPLAPDETPYERLRRAGAR